MKFGVLPLTIVFAVFFWHNVSAQDANRFKLSVRLLDPESIQTVATNFDVTNFGTEVSTAMKVINSAIEGFSAKNQYAVVRVTKFPSKEFKMELFARPAIPDQERAQFFAATKNVIFSRSNLVPLRFELHYVSGSPPKTAKGETWPPGSEPSFVLRKSAFEKATVKEKVKILQQWAREEVLPVLGAYQRSAKPNFEGVIGVGRLLEKTNFNQPMDVEKLLNSNFDYWRGMMEMGKGNALVTATRIFMEIANGNFSEANNFANLHGSFLDKKSMASNFVLEFSEFYSLLEKSVNPSIEAAIADFDRGDFVTAATKFEAVLVNYPRNPWARYELWFTRQHDSIPTNDQSWKDASKELYAMNSMYPMAAEAKNEQEGFELFCRMSMKEMAPPKNYEEFQQYLIKHADFAFDLGEYPWAAEAYWQIIGSFKTETYKERPMNDYLIYSIYKMGHQKILKVFPRDLTEVKKNSEQARKSRYEASPLFGAFKEKNP